MGQSPQGESLEQIIAEQVKAEEGFFLPKQKGTESKHRQVDQLDKVKRHQVFDPETHSESSLAELDEKNLPLSVQEKRQTVQVYNLFKEKTQWGEFYRMYGIVLIMLGGFFLVVPFYNVVCQTFGFSMRQHAKEYNFGEDKVNVFRKYRVSFMAHTQDDLPWEFQP